MSPNSRGIVPCKDLSFKCLSMGRAVGGEQRGKGRADVSLGERRHHRTARRFGTARDSRRRTARRMRAHAQLCHDAAVTIDGRAPAAHVCAGRDCGPPGGQVPPPSRVRRDEGVADDGGVSPGRSPGERAPGVGARREGSGEKQQRKAGEPGGPTGARPRAHVTRGHAESGKVLQVADDGAAIGAMATGQRVVPPDLLRRRAGTAQRG